MKKRVSETDLAEYERLSKEKEKIETEIERLESTPVIYGYARVSSKGQAAEGNSLESQEGTLRAAGATDIRKDVYTGTTVDRPELDKLLEELRSGDTLVVTKLDRVARNVQQGIGLINSLAERGVKVHVLNMGLLDNSETGRLIRNIMLCFAEFERDMIMQRTREGKEIARQKEGYHEGRKKTYTKVQLDHAIELLKDHSYRQVTEITGISKSTLIRERKAKKQYNK